MHTLERARNTARMNVTSHMVDISLREQLLQNHSNLNQPLSIKKILDDLKISNDYYKAFPILKSEGLGLHLKRQPNSCFVNNFLMLV